MANQEHLDMLRQGVEVWNQWREEHPEILPDMSRADLHEVDLSGVNFTWTYLHGANLVRSNLVGAQFVEAHLHDADLYVACLVDANLTGAYLSRTNLNRADLCRANLSEARLSEVNFVGCNLDGANLAKASMMQAIFGGIDFRMVQGLDTVKHAGPSDISLAAIYRSQGEIPEIFLRGAGVPDILIEYAHALIGHPINYYTCFISYSSHDHPFVERIYADLQSKGVRCWSATQDMKIGDEIRPRIDEAIQFHDKLLLVLSEYSLASTWVKKEVETAFEKEAQQKKRVLFPIRLDDAVMHTPQAWAADIRRTRHIGDFTEWKQHNAYQQAFQRLLRDLMPDNIGEFGF